MKQFFFTCLIAFVCGMSAFARGIVPRETLCPERVISFQEVPDDPDPVPYALVDEKPLFEGGDASTFVTWVSSRLVYPKTARENNIQGRVVLQCTIMPDGSLEHVKVIRGVHDDLNAEAVRVASGSPKWKPGKHEGQFVPVIYTFSVGFYLGKPR